MSILPRGERVKRAVRWIVGHLQEDPSRAVMPLVHEAAVRFDLTPKESEELIHFYKSGAARPGSSDAGSD